MSIWRDWEGFELNEPILNVAAYNDLQLKDEDGNVITATEPISGADWGPILKSLTAAINALPTEAERDLFVKEVTINEIRFIDPLNKITTPDHYVFGPFWQPWINKADKLEQTMGWETGTFDPRITQ